MHANGAWSVQHLKNHLQDASGIPAGDCRLLCDTKEITHGTLNAYVVNKETHLQCSLRLCGGGKAKSKGGKSFKKKAKMEAKNELIFKEDGQEYAQVSALLGNSRLKVDCADGKQRLCTIRGKLVRRAWVGVRDIILISLREWEDDKCDMIHKYTDDEARNLRIYKELPSSMALSGEDGDGADKENEGVIFGIDDNEEEIFDINDL